MLCCVYSLRVTGYYSDVCVYLSHHISVFLLCTKIIFLCSDHDITKQQQQQQKVSSPSLSQYFNKDNSKQQQQSNSDAVLGKENTSADLKALLPKQKMKFMKLDVSCFFVYILCMCFVLGIVVVSV